MKAGVGSGVRKEVRQLLRFVLGGEARALEIQPDNDEDHEQEDVKDDEGIHEEDQDDHEEENVNVEDHKCHLKGLENIRGSHQLSSAVAFASTFDHCGVS